MLKAFDATSLYPSVNASLDSKISRIILDDSFEPSMEPELFNHFNSTRFFFTQPAFLKVKNH